VESLKALTAATIIVLDRDQAALELVRDYGADLWVPESRSWVLSWEFARAVTWSR